MHRQNGKEMEKIQTAKESHPLCRKVYFFLLMNLEIIIAQEYV